MKSIQLSHCSPNCVIQGYFIVTRVLSQSVLFCLLIRRLFRQGIEASVTLNSLQQYYRVHSYLGKKF